MVVVEWEMSVVWMDIYALVALLVVWWLVILSRIKTKNSLLL